MNPARILTAVLAAAALVAATPSAAAPVATSPEFFGVTSATELSAAEYERMAGGGVTTLRVPIYWPFVEPRRPDGPPPLPGLPEDESRWSAVDEVVEGAARHGIRVLPFVYGTPRWVAKEYERPPIDGAPARTAWQDFLRDLVARYGPDGALWEGPAILETEVPKLPIIEWQIWNEANSPVFWKPRPSPAEYRELVAISGTAIRAADPAATIVLGGMFGAPTRGIRAWDFLRRFHEDGGAVGSFDAYALHPYAPDMLGIAAQARRLQREIAAGPAPDTPLWITEIGWPTDGPEGFELVQTERGQKRLLARSYRLFLAHQEDWGIAKLVWYVWRDNDVQADCTVCRYSGLFTERFEAKPAWRKLTQFAGGVP